MLAPPSWAQVEDALQTVTFLLDATEYHQVTGHVVRERLAVEAVEGKAQRDAVDLPAGGLDGLLVGAGPTGAVDRVAGELDGRLVGE